MDALTTLFNKFLIKGTTPTVWNNAVILIMHKEANIADLKNNKPISLLSQPKRKVYIQISSDSLLIVIIIYYYVTCNILVLALVGINNSFWS